MTAFQVNQTTGRLSIIVNAQVSSASGSRLALPYFPVPANPIDFTISSGYLETTSAEHLPPATSCSRINTACPPASSPSARNGSYVPGIKQATTIVNGTGYVYILDNEATLVSSGTSQVLPYTIGSGGSLVAQVSGAVADDPTLSNPIQLLVESKGKFLYVANQGNDAQGTNSGSGYAGYVIDPSTHVLSFIAGEPYGSGSAPQCIVEDPSDQFIYSADFNDSSVTGRVVDPNSGALNDMNGSSGVFALQGPATWCLIDGRTS